MKETKPEPTNIQPNLDNRNKTLQGCEDDTYNSEPYPEDLMGFFGVFL
ncbi:MAG: hypothetical protein P8X74_24045 [Reinekea sp.]